MFPRWRDDGSAPLYKIKGQRVGTDGSLLGSAFDVPSNSVQHRYPAVAYNPDDDEYLVVYQAYAGGNWRIRGRRVSGAGVPQGSDVEIGGDGNFSNVLPAVAYDPRVGEYLVVWQYTGTGPDNDLHARRVAADGTVIGDAFAVSGAAGSQQEAPAVGYGGQASLVAWQDDGSGDWVVYGRQYGALVAGFTGSPLSGTVPLTVTFADASTPAGTVEGYVWSFGDGVTSTLTNPVHVYTSKGTYTVSLAVTGGGEGDVLTRTHYIAATPSPSGLLTTTVTYGYDPLYRLTSATYSGGEVYTYTYDAVGNRLKKGVSGTVSDYVYDDANRLTSVDGVGYTWDNNGNLLDDGERVYTYDYANRLIQVVRGTFTTTFTYNGDGHRTARTENGATTSYVVAVLGLSQVLVETTGGNTTIYVYGHDLLAQYDGAAWAYHLNDGLGSVRQLADASGDVTLAQGYTPFGVPLWSDGSGSTGYGFTGERWEAYSALLFLRARYYEPGTGRFIQRDPWVGTYYQPQTLLRNYSYALNNPTVYEDPWGTKPTKRHIPERYSYSCRCGWIDWGHAGPGAAYSLIDKVLVENERNTLIKTRMKAFGGVLTTRGDYVINEDADNGPWAWTVSLGAFKDLSEAFEQDQAESIFPGETAFSEEDLPSNLIGFYIALYEHQGIFTNPNPKISEAERAFVERVCGCLDGQDSLRAFELYEEANAWREVRDWRDAHVDFDDGCEIASMCNGIPRSWPALFNTLPPIPKSRLLGFFWEYDWSVDGLVGRWIQEDVWELEDNG